MQDGTKHAPNDAGQPTAQPRDQPTSPRQPTKARVAGYVPTELLDQIRNAVAALGAHPDDPRSLSDFLERACRRELAELQQARNGGEAFPHRAQHRLVTGSRRRRSPGPGS